MKRLSLYLDTSVISFLFADDSPDERAATQRFFDDYVKPGIYDAWISPVVLDELGRTRDPDRKSKLHAAVDEYDLRTLEIAEQLSEIQALATHYMDDGIIPRKNLEDALHVAIATVNEADVLLSWNYRHLANVNKEMRITAANLRAGYTKPLRLLTPLEMLYEED